MCVLCGALLSDHWAESEGGLRARADRVQLINRILTYYGLSLDDWAGSVYTVRDGKGGSAVVQDVGTLWQAAEDLAGCRLDPLDPGLIESLEDYVKG